MSSEGFISTVAEGLLNTAFRNASYTATTATTWYVQLHTGHPGTGSSNIAGNTTRQSCTFNAASTSTSTSSIVNASSITWVNVSTSETYAYFSLWTAASSGSCAGSGAVTANAVTAGDTFTIAGSGLTISLNAAS